MCCQCISSPGRESSSSSAVWVTKGVLLIILGTDLPTHNEFGTFTHSFNGLGQEYSPRRRGEGETSTTSTRPATRDACWMGGWLAGWLVLVHKEHKICQRATEDFWRTIDGDRIYYSDDCLMRQTTQANNNNNMKSGLFTTHPATHSALVSSSSTSQSASNSSRWRWRWRDPFLANRLCGFRICPHKFVSNSLLKCPSGQI